MLIAELGWNVEWEKLTPEQQQVMVDNWPTVKSAYELSKRAYKEDPTKWKVSLYGVRRQRIGMEEAVAIQEAGIDISIEGVDGTMLTRMKDRTYNYGDKVPLELSTGQIVQITVPDLGLLQIDEVTWLENSCTEALQDKIDEGWRILAVCPPNAQRRPDYILGRRKRDVLG